jgi:hypothetical protein
LVVYLFRLFCLSLSGPEQLKGMVLQSLDNANSEKPEPELYQPTGRRLQGARGLNVERSTKPRTEADA